MAVETVEGVWNDLLHYHYDVLGDVLYLRLITRRTDEVYGVEDDDGQHILRSLKDDTVVGMTIVGYWRQFGTDDAPLATSDWQQAIERHVRAVGEHLQLAPA